MRLGDQRLQVELDESSALDIGSCRVEGVEIAPGAAVPDDGDPRILRAVGGMMFTCGPDHIRHPEPIEGQAGKRYPLHGSLSGSRPEILTDDKSSESHDVTARITVRLAEGGEAQILRRWRFDRESGGISLEDRLTNSGEEGFVPMVMYHMNIGAHLFDADTMLAGASFADGGIGWRFGTGDGNVFCVPAVGRDGRAEVRLGPLAAIGGRSLHVWFATDSLPNLQMWRNQAGHCNVLGIEPASHPWKKRAELEAMGLMTVLGPGQSRIYRMGFAVR